MTKIFLSDCYSDDELRSLLTAVLIQIHGTLTPEHLARIDTAIERRRKFPV